MSVYVDDMLRLAKVGRLTSKWSHMLADTHQELLDMAAELGLRPEWIQREGTPHEHFDLTEGKRLQVLGFGAVPITYPHGTAQIIRAKRDAIAHTSADCGCHADYHELGVHRPIQTQAVVVVHQCPVGDAGVTPCCGISPFGLPRTDQLTVDELAVTCSRAAGA